jgi:hypothetical protein
MATVRHLGLFALPELINNNRRSKCPQTSEAFIFKTLGNSFPVHAATIDNSPYVPMSLERAMLWNWRVKKWKAEVDIRFRIDEPEDTSSIQTMFFIESDKTNEQELVCGSGTFAGGESFYQDPDDAGPLNTPGDWDVGVSIGRLVTSRFASMQGVSGINASQAVRVSGETPPTYYLPVEISINVGGSGFISSATSGILIEHIEGVDLPITWTISDPQQTYTKPFRFGQLTDFVSGFFDISVAEYWPYDPNDGDGPIYDSATGEQLRAFPD